MAERRHDDRHVEQLVAVTQKVQFSGEPPLRQPLGVQKSPWEVQSRHAVEPPQVALDQRFPWSHGDVEVHEGD